jgi:hypothetical protein
MSLTTASKLKDCIATRTKVFCFSDRKREAGSELLEMLQGSD